jgi:hypothetical protein
MEAAAAELLVEVSRLGIELVAHGDRLRYRPRTAVTPDLAERLRIHKGELLTILRDARAPDGTNPGMWEDGMYPPEPCPACGGLLFWWNPLGDRRCVGCDPPVTAIRLLERAERLRQRDGSASSVGAAEMVGELRRLIDARRDANQGVESDHHGRKAKTTVSWKTTTGGRSIWAESLRDLQTGRP